MSKIIEFFTGNLLLMILAAFILLAALPPIIMILFPMADLIMRFIMIILIYINVRGYLGNGIPTLIVSAALIYTIVIKHAYLGASIYVIFYVLLMFQFLGVIVWGLNTVKIMTTKHPG